MLLCGLKKVNLVGFNLLGALSSDLTFCDLFLLAWMMRGWKWSIWSIVPRRKNSPLQQNLRWAPCPWTAWWLASLLRPCTHLSFRTRQRHTWKCGWETLFRKIMKKWPSPDIIGGFDCFPWCSHKFDIGVKCFDFISWKGIIICRFWIFWTENTIVVLWFLGEKSKSD